MCGRFEIHSAIEIIAKMFGIDPSSFTIEPNYNVEGTIGVKMHDPTYELLSWARIETQRRGTTPVKLLNYLRDEICKQVLVKPDRGEEYSLFPQVSKFDKQ